MRIVAISDLHGYLPLQVPPSDLVLIAGDVCPDASTREAQAVWLRDAFTPWAEQLETRAVVMCWGNHDFVGQLPSAELPSLPVDVVTDRAVTVEGMTIYATPWTRSIPGVWAFDVELDELAARMEAIPGGIDILMTHGPPRGVLDRVVSGDRVGSTALAAAVARVRPRLHVFGHIHESRGQEGTSYNVSVVDAQYQPYALPVTVIDL
jgi:Icc-related predicted phosphoesterase